MSTRATCCSHAASPRNLPGSKPLLPAYLAPKLGITRPRLLQCIRDPSQPSSAAEPAQLGGSRLTRMKESHEVHEIRQGSSDERHLGWCRPQHHVLRPKLFRRVSLCDRNQTASTTATGIISGFKIDHNTGKLTNINGLPISSGGANPGRAVMLTGGRFLYVLNQGTHTDGSPCTAANPCSNANITQFAVGGKRHSLPGNRLSRRVTIRFTWSPTPRARTSTYSITMRRQTALLARLLLVPEVTTCGDITAFTIDSVTGRLSLRSQRAGHFGQRFPAPLFPSSG